MKQIEAFVDEVYHGVGGNEKEIKELKAEMKNHLLEAVHELKKEGKSEREAIVIAIERFGGEKEMRAIVGQLFKAQKVFAKWMLYTALAFLVLLSVVFGTLITIQAENMHEQSQIATQIFDSLEGKEVVSQEIINEIETLMQSTNHIFDVRLYNVREVTGEGGDVFRYVKETKPDYEYKKDIWFNPVVFYPAHYGNGNGNWFVDMKTRIIDGLMLSSILFVGISVYWVLFSIWSIINAYHQKRLNVGWIIAFALLNVIGYLIYVLVGKRKIAA
jgi:ABC-type multidrug transport system fused ATPase/permease subunit